MKNRLLALMALCGATSSTLPLWAAWEDPELQFVEPNLATDGTGGGVYYVYHVATQKFMGNSATRLVVSDQGQEVTLTYGEDYELSRRPETDPEYFTGKGWRLSMMNAPTNGGYHELFLNTGGAEIYVDHNKTGHILWKIVKEGEVYRIKVIDEDKLYGVAAQDGLYANSYIAVGEGETEVDPLIDKSMAGQENAGDEWKFVSVEAYEAFQAKKKLLGQLNKADEVGFTGYGEYADVYNNPKATAEEVEAAATGLKQAIVNWQSSNATPEHPVDFTNVITNNSFADGTTNGWTTVGTPGVQSVSYETPTNEYKMQNFAEKWTWADGSNLNSLANDPMEVSQVLESMPVGKYRLTANTIGYQQGNRDIVPYGVYLYAENGGIESRAEAHSLEFGGLREGVVSESDPYPRNTVLEFFAMDGTIKVGFKTVNTNCNWVAVDNFKLEYLGQVEGGMAEELKKVITQAEELKNGYDLQFKKYSAAGETKFNQSVETAKQAAANPDTDDKTLGLVLTSLQEGMDELKADVNAYEILNVKRQELLTEWDESPYAEVDFPEYEKYVYGLDDAYEQRTFDPAEVDSIQPRADRLWMSCVREALTNGDTDNVTGLMVNPNFEGSNDGWTKTGDGDFKNDGTRVTEVWGGQNWEVYQEINNLPQGSYKIKAQAFYNPSSTNDNAWHEGWGQEGDETSNIHGYLFGNDASEPLLHVTACPQEENVAENCEEVTWTEDASLAGKWLCYGKNSAQEVFEADEGNYLNATTCYVGKDGKLRVGVKMSGVTWGAAWVVFDNFQVEYLGADNMDGAQTALDALIREADEMLASDALTTQEAKDGLSKAIEAASGVGELTPEIYEEQTEALNAAIKLGQESMDAAAALEDKAIVHSDRLSGTGEASYEAYVGTEGHGELETLVGEILDNKIADVGIFATLDEINDYSLRLDKAYSKMLSAHIDFTTASKDEPVDATGLIVNPSFQTKTENEQGEIVDTQSGEGWMIESEYDMTGVKDAMLCEIYSDSSKVYQPLYNAPAGYYRVVLSGFYRAGGYIEAGVAHRDGTEARNAELFIESGKGKWSEKLPSIFENVSEWKYETSDVALPDSLFPESDKLYHFIVDQPGGAKLAFEDGAYECDTYFYVGEGEVPVLGVRKTGMLTNDWSCFDNFRLYYLGDGDANKPDGFVDSIDGVAADGTAKVVSSAWYTINGVRVAEPKQRGIYIRQDMMNDGTKKTVKVLVK